MNNVEDNQHLQLQLKESLPKDLSHALFPLLTMTSLPVLMTDGKSKILAANLPLLSLLEYDLDILKSKKLSDLVHPDDMAVLRKILGGKNLFASPLFKVRLTDSAGKTIPIHAFVDHAGEKYASVQILHFFPDRKNASFHEPVIHFPEDLQEAGKTGLFEIDIKHHRFYGSQATFKMLNLVNKSGVADLAKVVALIYKKNEREKIDRFLMAPETVDRSFETEFRIRAGKDEEKSIRNLLMICCVDQEGDTLMIRGFLRDITAEKKVERELIRARNRAENGDHFKSVFLTNLSHELRTPMNAIIGFSELLKAEQSGNEHVNEYLSIIKNKGNYLLSLIDDVIELSRFERGDMTFRKNNFSLKQFMQELYEEFEARKMEKDKGHIGLILDLPDEYLDQNIYTDQGRLHQVLAGILSNAFKFTEKGRVEFGFSMSEKNYKFYVSDTGIGLSDDDQRRIFSRFEEIEDKALTKLGGTGLSLTIAKKIIDQLGGKIKVRSEVNKGSWFQVSLPVETPVKKKSEVKNEPGSLNDINWKDKVVLIAEDEELNFRFLEAVLQKTQAKVLRANNGKEAVDLCKNINHIDMILMDIKMPVMNGNEATFEIKQERPDLPIIAQTAFSIQEEIDKCREAGCDDFVTKPIDIKLLINKMSQFFQK